MTEIIYLDHAATSWPKPKAVVERTVQALEQLTGNAGRSGHSASLDSARTVFALRQSIADLLQVPDSANVALVRGCTEGLNIVLHGWLKWGDRVLVSPMEHNSVMRPLSSLARDRSLQIQTLPADPWGRVNIPGARELMSGGREASLLVVQHASNVNGAIQDLAGLRAAFPDTPILLDAAQTAGVLPIPVRDWKVDFVAASLHKGLLGPTGVGFCYIAPGRDVRPLMEGGTGSRSESAEHPYFRPDRYESGTLNLHGIAGGLGAFDGLQARGLLGPHKQRLTLLLMEGLRQIPGVKIHSPDDGTALIASFSLDGFEPDEIARRLDREFHILCRPGLHCSPAAHQHLGTFPRGTVRLSPGWGNSEEHVERTLAALTKIAAD